MADAYWRYGVAQDAGGSGSVPRLSSVPGYYPSETPSLGTHVNQGSGGLSTASTDYLQKDMFPLRSSAHVIGVGVHPEPVISGLTAKPSIHSYASALEDTNLISHRRDTDLGVDPIARDIIHEGPNSIRKANGSLVPGESNILFVDCLPNDCTRREVGHLFRPFIGFKEIRVVHKEARCSGDKSMVLCFVEFDDAKCALTAMEALQGYKFDDRKPDSPLLRINFAHFPFRLS
uniref:RRM domain-containing protein n=2 Tax=Kalanchoe fedtschenkoi TaxID=63787 RepID=A0A7N0RCZ7_KALFE